MNEANTSVICPDNDGESRKIIEISRRLSLDVRVSGQKWGAKLSKEPDETFLNLKKNLIIVEMPGKEREEELKKDHRVYILDHHKYDSDDRSKPLSSLEQFSLLIKYPLNREETGIALNDRGYIYLLQEKGYSKEEVKKIRIYDLAAQGYRASDFTAAEEEYRRRYIRGGVTVVESRSVKTAYLSDLHFLGKDQFSGLLVLTLDGNSLVRETNFFGPSKQALALHKRVGGFCGGDLARSMFWGKVYDKPPTKEETLQILIEKN